VVLSEVTIGVDFTLLLAIWGAVAGSIASLGGVTAWLTYRRNRPKLRVVGWEIMIRSRGPCIDLFVTNHGSQGAVVTRASLRHAIPPGEQYMVGTEELPAEVAPGGLLRLTFDLREWPLVMPLDTPLRPWVRDDEGRETWGLLVVSSAAFTTAAGFRRMFILMRSSKSVDYRPPAWNPVGSSGHHGN
jgi:hypothetical protein